MHMPPTDREIFAALAKTDFFAFTWRVFLTLHPDPARPFVANWHIEATEGQCDRLVITIPPRHLKSICAAVALPAWLLGQDPGCRILVASYGLNLARKHSEDFRAILESAWYRALFPRTRIAERGARQDEIVTTRRGFRKAVSLGGAAMGFGADVVIIDDLLKAEDATSGSDTERARVKSYIEGTLLPRLDDKTHGKVIAIQQRLHEDDPAGYLLETGAYTHLDLPAIAATDEEIPLGGGRAHRRRKGEVLLPRDAPWLEGFRRELMGFPNARHDDQVDSVSQFLNWLSSNRWLRVQARDPVTGRRERIRGRERQRRP